MTASTLTVAPANTNTTTFRAWGSVLSAAIAAAGMTQTADTGQINWTTVTLTSTANTSSGYEIWRFSDALQSTAPVFFKLEYGCGSSTITPGMWITVGTGSDGAGTITGTFFTNITAANQMVARTQLTSGSQLVYTSGTQIFVNGDTGGLAVLLWPNFGAQASNGSFFVLERTRAFDGTSTGDGYSFIYAFSDTSVQALCAASTPSFIANSYVTQTAPLTVCSSGAGANNTGLSAIVSGVLYPLPIFTGNNIKVGGPSQYLMAYPRGDYLGNQTLTFTHYAVSKNWLTLGLGQANSSQGWGGPGLYKSFLFRLT